MPATIEAKVNENAAARGAELKSGAEKLMQKHQLVGDVRGIGLMVALECVADRDSKKPASKDQMAAVFEGAYQAGVMIRVSGPNIILSPPLVVTDGDVQKILNAVDAGLTAGGAT